MESSRSEVLVLVDFRRQVQKMNQLLSYPELPTFDIDVIVHSFIDKLTLSTFPTDLAGSIAHLLKDDHLIENPEWSSEEEETGMKHYVHNVIVENAIGMRDHLRELKMLNDRYLYKRQINSYVHIFRKSTDQRLF